MTEQQWLSATEPTALVQYARRAEALSGRKARLFAAAACRQSWHWLTDQRSRQAVEVAELRADLLISDRQRSLARKAAREAHLAMGFYQPVQRVVAAAAFWAVGRMPVYAAVQVIPRLISAHARYRSINPTPSGNWIQSFVSGVWSRIRPADPRHEHPPASPPVLASLLRDFTGPGPFRPHALDPTLVPNDDGTVHSLAEAAYQERKLPEGTLDPLRLNILADALEELGADEELILHLRNPQPHVRGCWVVDLLTGRC